MSPVSALFSIAGVRVGCRRTDEGSGVALAFLPCATGDTFSFLYDHVFVGVEIAPEREAGVVVISCKAWTRQIFFFFLFELSSVELQWRYSTRVSREQCRAAKHLRPRYSFVCMTQDREQRFRPNRILWHGVF